MKKIVVRQTKLAVLLDNVSGSFCLAYRYSDDVYR